MQTAQKHPNFVTNKNFIQKFHTDFEIEQEIVLWTRKS